MFKIITGLALVAAKDPGRRKEHASLRLADDFVVGHHACATIQISNSFLEATMGKIVEDSFASSQWKISLEKPTPGQTRSGELAASLTRSLAYSSSEEGPQKKAEGSVTVGVRIGFQEKAKENWMTTEDDKVLYPRLELAAESECTKGDCDEFNEMAQAALDWDGVRFWDLPASIQTLKGSFRFINEFTFGQPAVHLSSWDDGTLALASNCLKKTIDDLPPSSSNGIEITASQNAVELLFPRYLDLSMNGIKTLLKDVAMIQGLSGDVGLVMDPSELASVPRSEVAPGISVKKLERKDKYGQVFLDELTLQQNVFAFVSDKGKDTTIMPIEVNVAIPVGVKDSIKTRHGTSQWAYPDLENVKVDLNLKECVHIPRAAGDGSEGADRDSEDDDDFDDEEEGEDDEDFDSDDEEKEEQPSGPKPKPSDLANLVCSMRATGMNLAKQHLGEALKSVPAPNWIAFSEIVHSFKFLCSGVQIRQPYFKLEEDRIVIRLDMADSPLQIDGLCNDRTQAKYLEDPAEIEVARGQTIKKRFSTALQESLAQPLGYHFIMQAVKQNYHIERLPSIILHHISHFFEFVDYCKGKHPEYSEAQARHCADTYLYFKKKVDYDQVFEWDKSKDRIQYFQEMPTTDKKVVSHYLSKEEQQAKLDSLASLQKILLYFGFFLFIMGFRVQYSQMAAIIVVTLAYSHYTAFLMPLARYGLDYLAYVVQAGRVAIGQTDYLQLQSPMGICQYPAGHLWYHLPHYYLHLNFEWAEQAIKFWHFLVQALTHLALTKLAYQIFDGGKSLRGQMVGFMLVCNFGTTFHIQELYNDNIMGAFLIGALFFMANGRPLLSSLFFTMGLSIKAPALFMLPGILGWTQYQHGPVVLLKSIVMIVGFQVIIALPFLFEPAARLLGFSNGAQTSLDDYLTLSMLLGPHEGRSVGVGHKFSYFWYFLDKTVYDGPAFSKAMQFIILGINVYYFFIRRACMLQCVTNLFTPFTEQKVTNLSRRKAAEVIAILYVASCAFMPGGQFQFQGWYWELLPLVLLMTNLPVVLLFQLYQNTWPTKKLDRSVHHIVMLLLVAFLFSIGTAPAQKTQRTASLTAAKGGK